MTDQAQQKIESLTQQVVAADKRVIQLERSNHGLARENGQLRGELLALREERDELLELRGKCDALAAHCRALNCKLEGEKKLRELARPTAEPAQRTYRDSYGERKWRLSECLDEEEWGGTTVHDLATHLQETLLRVAAYEAREAKLRALAAKWAVPSNNWSALSCATDLEQLLDAKETP